MTVTKNDLVFTYMILFIILITFTYYPFQSRDFLFLIKKKPHKHVPISMLTIRTSEIIRDTRLIKLILFIYHNKRLFSIGKIAESSKRQKLFGMKFLHINLQRHVDWQICLVRFTLAFVIHNSHLLLFGLM